MSSRKLGLQQGVNLRRSTRIRQSLVVSSPENEEEWPRENSIERCGNKKKKQRALAAEHHQQEPADHEMTLAKTRKEENEKEKPRENPTARCGNKKQKQRVLAVEHHRKEPHLSPSAETRNEVPVVELSSPSPEEEKPKFDILFLLEHAMEPNSREEVLPEDRQHLDNAASVLKSLLVARLTSSNENLKTVDMIDLANKCYRALRELGDDYRTFDMEVYKFIAQRQELEFAAKDKENWNQQLQVLFDVTDKLFSAQDKPSRTMSHAEHLKFKKDELTSMLHLVTEELTEEEKKIEALTVERDKCKEVHFEIEAGLEKLDAEKKEASMALEAINAQYDAAREEFERMSNHLLQLVRSSRSAKSST